MSEQAAQNLKEEMEREMAEARQVQSRYQDQLESAANTSRANKTPSRGAAADEQAAGGEEAEMTVLTDKSAPEDLRIEVIHRYAAQMTRRDDYIQALLTIVQDTSDANWVRIESLDALDSAAIQVARFQPHLEAYNRAMRNLINDPVPEIRETVVTTLASQHDPEVQQVLQQGLQGNGPLPVERERAISLLAEDDHLDNMPLLQELLGSADASTRQEAVRLMGSYTQAQDTLERVMLDKNESPDVREQSSASLRNLAPERFEYVAKEIATDTSEDPEMRAHCLQALQHLGSTENVYQDTAFQEKVDAVSSDESAPDVAQVARNMIEQRPPQP